MSKSARIILLLSILWTPQVTLAAKEAFEVEVRTDVKIPMRDGIKLSANIFLPKAESKFPVILVRSPYGKGDEKNGDGLFYAARGYVLVSQDCRGKGASQGGQAALHLFSYNLANSLFGHHSLTLAPQNSLRIRLLRYNFAL